MLGRWKSLLVAPLLSVLLLTNCEPASVGGPDSEAGPRTATVLDASQNSYTLVEGQPGTPALEVTKVVGLEGGSLSLLGHTLTVPAGAVEEPTLFTMTQLPNGFVEVELRAVVTGLEGVEDVGEKGFANGKKVALSLTYAWASNASDPSRLRILHLVDAGPAAPVPSRVDPASRTVTAELEHFSRYCMAVD